MNDFDENLKYEKSQQPIADNLYIRQFGNRCDIERYDWDNPDGQYMQRKGIDCSYLDRTQSPPKRIYVSEKFRKEDYGDMLIELYSGYPKKYGWGLTDHDVDYYFYYIDPESCRTVHFDPRDVSYGKAYRVDPNAVKTLANMAMEKFETSEWVEKWINSKVMYKKCLAADSRDPNFKYIKSFTEKDGKTKMSISVCVSWKDVKKFGKVDEYITVDLNHL